MTDVVKTQSTATVTVATPASATVNVTAAGTAVVRQEQATVVSDLQQVQSIQAPNWIQFNTSGTATPGVGRLMWNETDGTLEFQMKGGAVTQQIGMEQVLRVSANDNGGLLKGKVIYATGSDGVNLKVAYATATSETTSSKTLAVMTETVTGGNKGFATTFGLVRGLNTDGMTEGAAVWLSPTGSGNMTTTRPTTPDHAVFIGYCLRANQNNGVVFVNIQNGYELEELHNVSITSPANNEVLTYEASSGLWKNKVNAADGVTSVTASAPLTGGTITSTGTIGLDQSALVVAESQVTGLVTDLAGKLPQTGTYTTVRTNLAKNVLNGVNSSNIAATRMTLSLQSGFVRGTITDATVANFAQRFSAASVPVGFPVTAGQTYTLSAYGRTTAAAAQMGLQIQWYQSNGTTLISTTSNTPVTVNASTFTRFSYTLTAPTGAAYVMWYVGIPGTGARAIGDTVDVYGLLFEASSNLGDYFDGSTTSIGDIAYAWTGTANASTSTQTITTRNVGALDAQQLKIAGVDVAQQSLNVAKWSGASLSIVETAQRVNLNFASITSGTVLFSFFTPLVTTTVSNVSMVTATTAASGLTLARMGLYTFDETTATLVARTASDTTLFTATNTLYTRSFDTTGGYPATYTLQAGQRYALGSICVGTTMPSLYYQLVTTEIVSALPPRMTGSATSQTDLPTTRATFTNNAALMYGRFS